MGEEVEKLINDVQFLVSRMHSREKRFENFRQQLCHVQKQLNCMRQYQEDMLSFDELSSRLNKHPRGQLILCLAVENKHLEQLRMQNGVLRKSLEEYEAVFDLIMSKYRDQITGLMHANQIETYTQSAVNSDTQSFNHQCLPPASSVKDDSVSPTDISSSVGGGLDNDMGLRNSALSLQMTALASLAREVSDQSDAHVSELERELHRLRTENAGLRDVLSISRAHTTAIGADALVSEALEVTRPSPMNNSDENFNVSSSGVDYGRSLPEKYEPLSDDVLIYDLMKRTAEDGTRYIERSEIDEGEEEESGISPLNVYNRIHRYN